MTYVISFYNSEIILGFKFTSCFLPVCLKSSILIASLGKKAARKSVNVDEEEDNELSDLEEEGQKENEDLGNDGGSPVSKPKKKRKRKNEQDASGDQTNDKKNKTDEQGTGVLHTFSTCLCPLLIVGCSFVTLSIYLCLIR